jgi:hypothetical protein
MVARPLRNLRRIGESWLLAIIEQGRAFEIGRQFGYEQKFGYLTGMDWHRVED